MGHSFVTWEGSTVAHRWEFQESVKHRDIVKFSLALVDTGLRKFGELCSAQGDL